MLLEGETKTTGMEFAAYLRTKKLTPQYSSLNSRKISYKGKCLCYIKLSNKMERGARCAVFYLDKYAVEFSEGGSRRREAMHSLFKSLSERLGDSGF